ncbi:hypothetical protein [Enterococcus faecalis]|uniref:hypothetical protein n=1 Tax=Enterococcus faecalis TaxID=1351 RepID=UPI0021C6426B|nr:hypothetical protein [Enterococcus faecalis]
MKQFKIFFSLIVVTLFLGLMGSTSAQAQETRIQDYPQYKDSTFSLIPAENSFVLRYSNDTSVKYLSGANRDGYLQVGDVVAKSEAMVYNVGYYQGKSVNMRITLTRDRGGVDLYLTPNNFLGMVLWTPGAYAEVTYDFFDAAGYPLPLQTTLNFAEFTNSKEGFIYNAKNTVKDLYATEKASLYTDYDGTQDLLKLRSDETSITSRGSRLAITTNEITQLKFRIKNKGQSGERFNYSSEFFSVVGPPAAQVFDATYDSFEKEPIIEFSHYVPVPPPNIRGPYYPKMQYVLYFRTDQFQLQDVVVTDGNGNNCQDFFEWRQLPDKTYRIYVKDSALRSSSFYNRLYKFKVKLKSIAFNTIGPVPARDIENNYFHRYIPFWLEIDMQKYKEQSISFKMNYEGYVKLKFLDKDNNQKIAPEKTIKGVITWPYDLTNEYPKILGYVPIIDRSRDIGRFRPEVREVTHYYRKVNQPVLKLNISDNPLYFPQDTLTRELPFSLTKDPEDIVTLKVRYENEERELKKYPAGNSKIEDKITFRVPDGWDEKEIDFYAEGESGLKSKIERRKVIVEKGPSLVLPGSLVFGTHEIPATSKEIKLENEKNIKIVDNRSFSLKKWRLLLKRTQPFLNSQKELLNTELVFIKSPKQRISINEAPQEVATGTGTKSLQDIGTFALTLTPDMKVGTYHAELRWILEDAPN